MRGTRGDVRSRAMEGDGGVVVGSRANQRDAAWREKEEEEEENDWKRNRLKRKRRGKLKRNMMGEDGWKWRRWKRSL